MLRREIGTRIVTRLRQARRRINNGADPGFLNRPRFHQVPERRSDALNHPIHPKVLPGSSSTVLGDRGTRERQRIQHRSPIVHNRRQSGKMTLMRTPESHIQMLSTLRFALNVMEERSHIGLDDKTAGTVRQALLHQILETESALHFPPSAHVVGTQKAKELLQA